MEQNPSLNNFGNQLRSVSNAPLSPSLCNGTQPVNTSGTHGNMGGHFQSTPGALMDQLHQFSREVVDLIKHQPGCQILLSKFIPSYHHHFGKQCRVADYGYSKLHELIDALPNVVHVMGSGHLRLLTLSHRVQVRRFTNELIKVLKSQSTKSCRLGDYAAIYRRIYRKEFRITDYGVCYLADMLSELSDNAVEINGSGPDAIIALPKRVQTAEERERTELFAIEVADLLCQSPRCRLPFNKFIPSYHHHFSRQCRVADYGFTKLVDLLEAVPNVVKIIEEQGEKYVTLVRQRHLQIVAEQLLTMLEAAPGKRIPLDSLINVYMKHQGYALCLEDFGMTSIRELLSKLPRLVRIETVCLSEDNHLLNSTLQSDKDTQSGKPDEAPEVEENKPRSDGDDVKSSTANLSSGDKVAERVMVDYVCLADRTQIKHLAHKVLLVLLETPTGALSVPAFSERFRCTFRDEPNLKLICEELANIVEFRETRPVSDANQGIAYCQWEEPSQKDSNYHSDCLFDRTKLTTQKDESHPSDSQQKSKSTSNETETISKMLNYYNNLESVNAWIALRPLIMFARELRELLRQNQGKILLVQLCAMYQRRFGVPLKPQRYNYPSLATLLQAVDFVALMRGRGVRCTLLLCQDFLGKLSYRVAYNTKPVLDDQTESNGSPSSDCKGNVSDQTQTTINRISESTLHSSPIVSWSQSENITKLIQSPEYSSTLQTPWTSTHQLNGICSSFNPTYPDSSVPSTGFLAGPTYRPYPLTYAQYPTNNAGQMSTYGAPPQLTSATYSYYQVPPTQHNTLTHQIITRPSYIGPLIPESHSTFTILPNNGGYNCSSGPYSSDCHLTNPGAYGQIAYSSQPSNFTPVTVIPNGNSMANTNVVGPGGEHPSTNLAYTGSLLSAPSMCPYNLGVTFTNPLHQFNCNPHNPNLQGQRLDAQHTMNVEPGSTLGRPIKTYEHGYTNQNKGQSSVQAATETSRAFGVSSTAQQQLDELVERLAYDNSTNSSGTETRSCEDGKDKTQHDSATIAEFSRSNGFSQQPLSHFNKNMVNGLSSLGNVDPHRNSYPQALFSAYCAPQNPSVFHVNTFSNSTLYPPSIYDSNLSQRLYTSGPIDVNHNSESNVTLNSDVTMANPSNGMTCEERKLENVTTDCHSVHNLPMRISSNLGVIDSDLTPNETMNAHGNSTLDSLQSALPHENSSYTFDQCRNKQGLFGTYNKDSMMHFTEETMSAFMKHNQESFMTTISSKNESDYMDNVNSIASPSRDNKHVNLDCLNCNERSDLCIENKLRDENPNSNRPLQPSKASVNQSDSNTGFVLDGFMADLRRDSEQRQQPINPDHEKEQQQQQQNTVPLAQFQKTASHSSVFNGIFSNSQMS